MMLPRQQDPSINFNWISIITALPGASAIDIEKKITDPLEEAIRNVSDIDFVSSNSREGVSSILVRFEDIDTRIFDKRINDLRREIQNKEKELPDDVIEPFILEITSANAWPSASLIVTSIADDENLRSQANQIQKDLERLEGVDRVDAVGLHDPELHVLFNQEKLSQLKISPSDLADSVSVFFQDIAVGSIKVDQQNFLIRLIGSDNKPSYLASLPVLEAKEQVLLGEVAQTQRGQAKRTSMVSYHQQPAVLLFAFKKENANLIQLVEKINQFIKDKNQFQNKTGVELVLVDDQTLTTKNAITVMQNNALLGLILVLFVTWIFLGSRIALLVTIGIPFTLAATFLVIKIIGETLNISVLLGIVIALGMLVDDAVVIVESIYYRIQKGMQSLEAAIAGIKEVATPVITSVMTTMAAFLPLMLLPGILGDYMRVIPMVVTLALALSLIEAFWLLPNHVTNLYHNNLKPSLLHKYRHLFTHKIQIYYARFLIFNLRNVFRSLSLLIIVIVLFALSIGAIVVGKIPVDFFANDPIRLFYINVQMPPNTPLETSLEKVKAIERKITPLLDNKDLRQIVSFSGYMLTETEPLYGDHYGQIQVSLHPKTPDNHSVSEVIDNIENAVMQTSGPIKISFTRISGGPPIEKPIKVKVVGNNYQEIRSATEELENILKTIPGVVDITNDANKGQLEYSLRLDHEAIYKTGLNPAYIQRNLRLLADGEIVASMQDNGEKVEVRIKASQDNYQNIEDILQLQLPLPDKENETIALQSLVYTEANLGLGNIRHYDFNRAITVEADIINPKENNMNTQKANAILLQKWNENVQANYPNVSLDFTGELDDINEAINAIGVLFLMGMGLIYLILGTQFMSYWQPILIMVTTIPLAFTGVALGLLISGNAISLYTLYGVVALAGIAVNAAIVLISAINARYRTGMGLLHAIIYAGRRRVIPVLITAFTTIAGLFALAFGLGGKSLLWGPVANAIVFGLLFSTLLTLIVVPTLYYLIMRLKFMRNI